MDLRIAVIQHEPATGLGAFGDLLGELGAAPEVVRAGEDPIPEPEALGGVIVLGGSARATDPALAEERAWIGQAVAAGVPTSASAWERSFSPPRSVAGSPPLDIRRSASARSS